MTTPSYPFAHSARSRRLVVIVALLVVILAAACALPSLPAPTGVPSSDTPTSEAPPTVEGTPVPAQTPLPAATATPTPPKDLIICQGQEPDSLFIYDAFSPAALNVLDAIYDAPVEINRYQMQPGILERLPSIENGGAEVRAVEVGEGDTVFDRDHQIVELVPGLALYDATGEPITFQSGTITTTQTVVTFTLRPDVSWADGEPLTAFDSQYSYELASALQGTGFERQLGLTASYEAVDERTIVWTGVPGYRDTLYPLNLYHPLPRHTMGDSEPDELRQSDRVRRQPLGWGPFVVDEWVDGEHIRLVPNPHYSGQAEGLPLLESVTFRFIADGEEASHALTGDSCHILTPDLVSMVAPQALQDAVDAGQIRLTSSIVNEWEHLDFGIRAAPGSGRVPFFADARVRQGVAQCIDRERIAGEAFPFGGAALAHSYVPSQHFLYAAEQLRTWPYDPDSGRSLLEEVGWQERDGHSVRVAQAVPDIAAGTPFTITLLTTAGDPARERTSQILKENLAACGIGMETQYLPPETLYADGPEGPVFGRRFDLALFSWLNGLDAPCEIYLSTQIPTEANWWSTFNNPGYENPDYDEACLTALAAFYGTEAHVRHHAEAQAIFSRDLPVLPLYFVPEFVAVSREVRGLILDPSQQTPFWNIKRFDLVW